MARARKLAAKPPRGIVQLDLPGKLVNDARARLEGERGIKLETYIQMHLRVMLRSRSILCLQDTMPFGKYQGEIIENVVRADPSYMTWLISQNGKTTFEMDVIQLTTDIME